MNVAVRLGLLILLILTLAAAAGAQAANEEASRKAIAGFESVLAADPTNVSALSGLATLYQTVDIPKAIDIYLRLTRVAPQNPVNFYAIGSNSWILAYNKANPLPEAERARVIAQGLENIDIALRLDPLYEEAMTYKNLLLRQKAQMATNPAEAARLEDEATLYFNRALEVRRLKQPLGVNSAAARAGAPPPPPPPPPGAVVQGIQIGADMAQQNLITRVPPNYPPLARAARIQDYVTLQTTIDRTGAVVDVKVLRGHPLLSEAAVEAVKQWRYKPILLNGQPIDVTTTVIVNFSTQ